MDEKEARELVTLAKNFMNLTVDFINAICGMVAGDTEKELDRMYGITESLESAAREAKGWLICVAYDRMESEMLSIPDDEKVPYDN
jgi:hypothetical protein